MLDSATFYYREARNSITSNYRDPDAAIKINLFIIEKMLNMDVDFYNLEKDVNKREEGEDIKPILIMINSCNRNELLDMILQNKN